MPSEVIDNRESDLYFVILPGDRAVLDVAAVELGAGLRNEVDVAGEIRRSISVNPMERYPPSSSVSGSPEAAESAAVTPKSLLIKSPVPNVEKMNISVPVPSRREPNRCPAASTPNHHHG